jgi:transcriptional regulator with XRE-family HTH domain
MNQSELARRLGISPNRLNQWEAGSHYPAPLLLLRLCEQYYLSMDYFYHGKKGAVSSDMAALLQRAEKERSSRAAA